MENLKNLTKAELIEMAEELLKTIKFKNFNMANKLINNHYEIRDEKLVDLTDEKEMARCQQEKQEMEKKQEQERIIKEQEKISKEKKMRNMKILEEMADSVEFRNSEMGIMVTLIETLIDQNDELRSLNIKIIDAINRNAFNTQKVEYYLSMIDMKLGNVDSKIKYNFYSQD